jgi:hypothetical protein
MYNHYHLYINVQLVQLIHPNFILFYDHLYMIVQLIQLVQPNFLIFYDHLYMNVQLIQLVQPNFTLSISMNIDLYKLFKINIIET